MADALPIAVTIGEPAGIGPDIILDAWLNRHQLEAALPVFYVIGDAEFLTTRAKTLGQDVPVVNCVSVEQAHELFSSALPVVPLSTRLKAQPGQPHADDAFGVIEAIEMAVLHVHKGKAGALVTAPINKDCLYAAGFSHPGHTEFLAELAQQYWGGDHTSVMMIAGPQLRTVPITIHIPISKVPAQLSRALIVETGMIVANDLNSRFGIVKPRLAVAGLNPHAGENGSMGKEDRDIIQPAIAELAAIGIDVRGPLPADTMFHASARSKYDVALCMYHDQALIPAKTLGFDDAVNVTLGLPFIRTSPDHGTAFDIAGSGKANPASMIAAIQMAHAMVSSGTSQ